MLAVSGDVIVQTIGAFAIAVIGAVAALAAARRAGRGEKAVDGVAAELQPNGGASIRDAVDRLERRVTAIDERFGHVDSMLDRIERRLIRGDDQPHP